MDVETDCPKGYVKSEVLVKQPIVYDNGPDKDYTLEKILCGLSESPTALVILCKIEIPKK